MGSVWKAKHTRLKKFVALKLLPQETTSDVAAIARFNRKMEAVGALKHPHIIEALDAGEENGTHYLVMEYVAGIELATLSKKVGQFPIADACELMRQTALGLQHADEHGLVHRDIKPSNLLLAVPVEHAARVPPSSSTAPLDDPHTQASRLCHIKILDLGLALLLGDQPAEELTSTGQVMGTLDYIAPEQLADTHAVDIRADLYSLGCTLFRVLTTEPPFAGPSLNTAAKKMFAHSFTPAPKLLDRRPDVPAELSALVARLLEKPPAARFATPREVATALAPFCVGHNLPALLASSSPASSKPDPFASTVIPESRLATPGRPAVPNTESQTAEGGHPPDAREPRAPQWRRVLAVSVLACVAIAGLVSRMAAPGRPSSAPSQPTTSQTTTTEPSDQEPAEPKSNPKTAEGGHPTSDATDERADWPEWAKELREPPPLEEWLQGRKVLTVQQDGSAMFQTIQAALDKVQPGEVIRVLDKGPYREQLDSRRHPGNFGLVSDVNTVIELAKWDLEQKFKTTWLGHTFSTTRDLRISGFKFVCTPPAEDKSLDPAPGSSPIYLQVLPGLCLEDCVVLAPQRIDDATSSLVSESILPIYADSSLCLRRNVFGTRLMIGAWQKHPYAAVVTQCFFATRAPKNAQIRLGFDNASHCALIERNVFDERGPDHAVTFATDKETPGDDRLLFTRNTIMSQPDRITLIGLYGSIGREVTFRDNLLSPSTRGFNFGTTENRPFAAKAREEWLVRNNWGGQRSPLPDWVPLTDLSYTGELPYLSLDAEHPNFLRLDPAKLPAGLKDIPGALPPGPPPPAGDWFTRLQARLKEAQAASRAQYK